MLVYLVGGAVRDELLGLPVKERDWVVVGSDPEEMINQGFKQVGKDFPVYLHPQSKEEYALARTERKKGRGYYGFEVHASPDVTLEEDLLRRDLTINAMAKSETGEIIDPYGGQQDLEAKILRHVSTAFIEDPLRVLRVARFAAALHTFGFTIASETLYLMRQIVNSGELEELIPERIWQETQNALASKTPSIFFSVLHEIDALAKIYPSINEQFKNLKARQLGLIALETITLKNSDPCVRFSAMFGGLYYNNQDNARHDVDQLGTQLHLPNSCVELLRHTADLQHLSHSVHELDEKQLLNLLHKLDGRRKPERFSLLLQIFSTIYTVATGKKTYLQAERLKSATKKISGIDINQWVKKGISGKELADKIETAQRQSLKQLINN